MLRLTLVMGIVIIVANCGNESFGPDLGPTVGPEHDGLLIELSFPVIVSVGEPVTFHVTLTNTGSAPDTLPQPHFDVFVLSNNGKVLWNYLYGAGVIGTEFVLAPNESFEIDLAWDQRLNQSGSIPPGDYDVLAVFFDLPPALVTHRESLVIVTE
jgi:hypothetical protein